MLTDVKAVIKDGVIYGCIVEFFCKLQEYKTKMQETQMDLQRQLQAAKKVRFCREIQSSALKFC